jgi:ATP adenylyltransferase
MKNLWTPWRMAYITGQEGREEGCIFDRNPDQPHDKENLILFRDPLVVVLLNRFPYANGHLLIAPQRHIPDIVDLTVAENTALIQIIQASVEILRKHYGPDGFNIGLNIGEVAGAGLADHLHFHVVPRWNGDHNFMTVLAEVRTIPQHIEQTFDLLLPEFQRISKK